MLVPERGEPTTKIGSLVGMAGGQVHRLPVTEHRVKANYHAKRSFFDREFVRDKIVYDQLHYCSFESQEMIRGSESKCRNLCPMVGSLAGGFFQENLIIADVVCGIIVFRGEHK